MNKFYLSVVDKVWKQFSNCCLGLSQYAEWKFCRENSAKAGYIDPHLKREGGEGKRKRGRER